MLYKQPVLNKNNLKATFRALHYYNSSDEKILKNVTHFRPLRFYGLTKTSEQLPSIILSRCLERECWPE